MAFDTSQISQLYLAGFFKDIGMDFDDKDLRSEFEDSKKRRDLSTTGAKEAQVGERRKAEQKQEKHETQEKQEEKQEEPEDPLSKFDTRVLETARLPVIDKRGGGSTEKYRWSQTPMDVTIQFHREWIARMIPEGAVLRGREVEMTFDLEHLVVKGCGVTLLRG